MSRPLFALEVKALHRAMHSMENAAERWGKCTNTDEAMTRQLGFELGLGGGSYWVGFDVDYRGGKNPRVHIETREHGELILSGRALLVAARQVLDWPIPGKVTFDANADDQLILLLDAIQ